jgi:hypothetical protein
MANDCPMGQNDGTAVPHDQATIGLVGKECLGHPGDCQGIGQARDYTQDETGNGRHFDLA